MRATSIPVVLLLALASGCSRDEEPVAVASPPEPPPIAPLDVPAPAPGPSPATLEELVEPTRETPTAGPANINSIRERAAVTQQSAPPSNFEPRRTLDRLTFQCADEKTFAIRVRGSRLELFPPGYTINYLVLTEVSSDSGVHYTANDADFRLENDIATLSFGRDRYVDCVSSPAAAVWQAPPRRDLLPR
jgi:membrane-bound inhibitor of C-type lysozyme